MFQGTLPVDLFKLQTFFAVGGIV